MSHCTASVLVRDDRWGGIRSLCELNADHPGPHVSKRSCCEPPAWLSWVDTAPGAVAGHSEAARGASERIESGQ